MNKQHNTRAITDDRRFSFVHSLPTRLVTITISHLKKNRRRNIAHAYVETTKEGDSAVFDSIRDRTMAYLSTPLVHRRSIPTSPGRINSQRENTATEHGLFK